MEEKYAAVSAFETIKSNRLNRKIAAQKHCEYEIEKYKEEREAKLIEEINSIDLRSDNDLLQTADEILTDHILSVIEPFIAKAKHSKEEHAKVIDCLNFHKEIEGYFLPKKTPVIEKTEELLTKLYAENIVKWRSLFGVRYKIEETMKHFLRRIPNETAIATLSH
jgi:hypothetical protein